MSYGIHYETFDEVEVYNDVSEDPCLVSVEIVVACTDPGRPPSGRDQFYDPGEAPLWEVDFVRLFLEKGAPLRITEEQLISLFPRGVDMVKEALENASRDGEYTYYEEL